MQIKDTFLVFIFCFFSLAFAQSQTKINSTSEYYLKNCFSIFDKKNTLKTKNGWQFWFVDKTIADGYTLKMSKIASDSATHIAHSHPDPEIFYILEGKAEFTLGNEKTIAGPNSSLYCPPNILHGIRNAGTDSLKYLVLKQYLSKGIKV